MDSRSQAQTVAILFVNYKATATWSWSVKWEDLCSSEQWHAMAQSVITLCMVRAPSVITLCMAAPSGSAMDERCHGESRNHLSLMIRLLFVLVYTRMVYPKCTPSGVYPPTIGSFRIWMVLLISYRPLSSSSCKPMCIWPPRSFASSWIFCSSYQGLVSVSAHSGWKCGGCSVHSLRRIICSEDLFAVI